MKRYIIKKVLTKRLQSADIQYPTTVVFANGKSFAAVPGESEITIRFMNSWAEWSIILMDDIGFSESYISSQINIDQEDGLEKLIRMFRSIPSSKKRMKHPVSWFMTWLQARKTDTASPDKEIRNLMLHYNLPAEFFHFMTGELFGYTEGYIENGDETQNEAQYKKYNYMCRKLLLKEGDELVEVGTAWGSMSLIAAKKYGANVTNYGLIPEQNRVFEERIENLGLKDKVKNVVRNARQLGEEKEKYDKYVSLGVYEHAGYARHEEWIQNIADCLKPDGIGVMTFTGYTDRRGIHYITDKYIWRGCYLPKLGDVIELMGKYNLNVIDVENARFFYADTMKVMRGKLNEHWDKIQSINPEIFDEKFKRVWNIYYLAAIESFYSQHSTLHAFQVTFTKGRSDVYPRTKDFMYKNSYDMSDMHEYEVPLP